MNTDVSSQYVKQEGLEIITTLLDLSSEKQYLL